MKRFLAAVVVAMCGGPLAAIASAPAAADQHAASRPDYSQADALLRDIRMAVSSPDSARRQIEQLEALLDRYPDYPGRGTVLYCLGLSYQSLDQNAKAVAAFDRAIQAKPELEATTSIASYRNKARTALFITRATGSLVATLASVLAAAILVLLFRAATVRWGRLCGIFAGALALWAAALVMLPMLLGPGQPGLEGCPEPVLVNFRAGQIGDNLLWTLGAYGAGAILAAMAVTAAAGRLRRPILGAVLGLLGTLVVVASVMGLFVLRHCYQRVNYDRASGRLVFMVKDVGTMQDVPDDMLPLYDEGFRERVLQAREHGK